MKTRSEKLLVMLVVFSFAFTLINTFVVRGGSLTEEEAIEISRNYGLVRDFLENADSYTLEVHHMNQTQIVELIEKYPYRREEFPQDHGVWYITWYIHPKNAPSAFKYVVTHIIDEETGEITHEGATSAR